MNIFVSYRRSDSRDITERLIDHLKAEFGDLCLFQDVESIGGGHDFRDLIMEGIRNADVVLVIIGPQWTKFLEERKTHNQPDYVLNEVECALENDKFLIPVLVGGAVIPSNSELPENIQSLSYLNSVNIRPNPDYKHDVKALIKDIYKRNPGPFQITHWPTLQRYTLFSFIIALIAITLYLVRGILPHTPSPTDNANIEQHKETNRAEAYALLEQLEIAQNRDRSTRREKHWAKVEQVLNSSEFSDRDKEKWAETFIKAHGSIEEINPRVTDPMLIKHLKPIESRLVKLKRDDLDSLAQRKAYQIRRLSKTDWSDQEIEELRTEIASFTPLDEPPNEIIAMKRLISGTDRAQSHETRSDEPQSTNWSYNIQERYDDQDDQDDQDDGEASRSTSDTISWDYKSQILQESGRVSVGKAFPFFSGWALTDSGSEPLNLGRILKRNKRGYLVSIASQCHYQYPLCNEVFKRITKARARLEDAEVDVIVIVADTSRYAKHFREEFGLNWTSVIVDEFKTYSSKMCPDSKDHKRSCIFRSFMLDSEGRVTLIVSKEGDDYLDLMLESL